MTTLAQAETARAAPPSTGNELPLEQAVPMFLEYMRSYRSCAPLSVQAYRANLRNFQQFLCSRPGPLPTPAAITRQLVIQYAVSLSHWSPVTVRSKLACLSCPPQKPYPGTPGRFPSSVSRCYPCSHEDRFEIAVHC